MRNIVISRRSFVVPQDDSYRALFFELFGNALVKFFTLEVSREFLREVLKVTGFQDMTPQQPPKILYWVKNPLQE